MGINAETMLMARARLADQIDTVAADFHGLTPAQRARKVDAIRSAAQDYGIAPIVELAYGLEKALAASVSLMFALPFLEAMREAIGCEALSPNAAQVFLASINQRLYG